MKATAPTQAWGPRTPGKWAQDGDSAGASGAAGARDEQRGSAALAGGAPRMAAASAEKSDIMGGSRDEAAPAQHANEGARPEHASSATATRAADHGAHEQHSEMEMDAHLASLQYNIGRRSDHCGITCEK